MRTRRITWMLVAALVALSLSASCSAGQGTGDAPTTSVAEQRTSVVPADCSGRSARPAVGPLTFAFDGVERAYLLALPAGYDGRTAVPLVFDLHGYGGSKEKQDRNTAMVAKGTERGYAVVTPDALGSPPRWNFGAGLDGADDYGFVAALAADLQRRLCVDPERIFVAGHSNGSAFAGLLVCRAPHLWAGVAMVSATVGSDCPSGVAPATIAIAGTADTAAPYQGPPAADGTPGTGAPGVIAATAARYGCAEVPRRDEVEPGVRREVFDDCDGGSEVALVTIVDGTHPWPGGPAAMGDPSNSEAGRTFDATAAILDFFARHTLTKSE